MPLIEVGRVCIKTAGREASKKCVVIRVLDENFAEVTGPKDLTTVRRRRVNVRHLVPLNVKIDIKEGASDAAVKKALKGVEIYGELTKEAE